MEIITFYNHDDQELFNSEVLVNADAEETTSLMRQWFEANYVDPVDVLPYESREGGYIWLWGGPYDAREVLQEEFQGFVDDKLIDELADELETTCWGWSRNPGRDDYDQYYIRDIESISEYHCTFQDAIKNVEKLLAADPPSEVEDLYYRMLYANIITAMETYLSDAFKSKVLSSSVLLRKFVERTPTFKKQKILFSEVFKEVKSARARVFNYLSHVSWHDIKKVQRMYRDTLGVKFPDDIGVIEDAINVRHVIVHRNGKMNDGTTHDFMKSDVQVLKDHVEKLIREIDSQLPNQQRDEDEDSSEF